MSLLCCRYLKPDENKKSKHKTAVKKKTLNPEFNEVKLQRFSLSLGFICLLAELSVCPLVSVLADLSASAVGSKHEHISLNASSGDFMRPWTETQYVMKSSPVQHRNFT